VDDMKEKNKQIYTGSREEVINMGYVPCKRCNP
jgi:methylphosphotriester-DNA--protein-cysteine methyltransferase